jgi:hypothetical protein
MQQAMSIVSRFAEKERDAHDDQPVRKHCTCNPPSSAG